MRFVMLLCFRRVPILSSIAMLEIIAVSIRVHVHVLALHVVNVWFSVVKDSIDIVKDIESRCLVSEFTHILFPKFFVRIEHVQYYSLVTGSSTYQSIFIS